MSLIGFDSAKYVAEQAKDILSRVEKFDKKLYLEFGGKLLFDFHAARVLPGYEPNAKMEILQKLKEKAEVVFCVSARDIQSGRLTGGFGINYKDFTLKSIDDLREQGIAVSTIVINLYSGEPLAKQLGAYLEAKGFRVYYRGVIPGYPQDTAQIASNTGYGASPHFETKKPLVILTGAGPNSGKMSTCLAMVYQDTLNGRDSGYAKFETFPIWNLPLLHPINIAYESATANIGDYNMIDPYHLEAYGISSVNYNRDVENFAIIQKILHAVISKDNYMHEYKSPTDMGVNMAKKGIVDLDVCAEAAKQEIVRRYFHYRINFIRGMEREETVEAAKKIMGRVGLNELYRKSVGPARTAMEEAGKSGKGNDGVYCGSAIELFDGKIVTGKNSPLLHSESAMMLNALKVLSGIPEERHLIAKEVIEEIKSMKKKAFREKSANLSLDETLVALSISANKDEHAKLALSKIGKLRGAEMHSTYLLDKRDERPLKKLGVNVTSDGIVPASRLYFD